MHPELTFQPSILLTGATGLLGRACLPHLIARHGAERIVALVRRGRDTSELEALGVRSLEVDLCASNLGIPVTVFRPLSKSIVRIIHAAADIRFGVSLAESRCVNVLGTENLLRFAAQCSRLERFAYISTVYVWGGKPGRIREEAAQPGGFANPHQQTKFEAEQVMLAAMAPIPAAIYRFSTMIYDCSAERVTQFNYFHQLLRLEGDQSTACHSCSCTSKDRSDRIGLGRSGIRFPVCRSMAAGRNLSHLRGTTEFPNRR